MAAKFLPMRAESNLFELCRMQLKFIKMYTLYLNWTITSKLDAYFTFATSL